MFLLLACTQPTERAPSDPPTLAAIEGEDNGITTLAAQAVDQSPDWLADDLQLQFEQLDSTVQDDLAVLLVDLDDPYLYDEVAFAIAHSSPEDLTSGGFVPGLLVENAQWIYDIEPLLDYVTLVEYGEPGDPDHYTTTSYVVSDADGELFEVEIDPEVYYWFVVHPSIEDESPWYVEAWDECKRSSLECPSSPEEGGTFWRHFLWEGARDTCPEDDQCPVLDEILPGLEVAWTSGSYADEAGAISQIARFMLYNDEDFGRWLTFGAYDERSIQPNRIYGLGRGNCGEWADMTTALTRTALIPNYNVAPASWDHTWNEFYDAYEDRWVAWEPVNFWLDHAYGAPYSNYATRGDSQVFNVTTQYIEDTFTMQYVVTDADGLPVDGASVALITPWDDGWGYAGETSTDIHGVATFEVRAESDYAFRVDHPTLGGYPDESFTYGSQGIAIGETDITEVSLPGSREPLPVRTLEPLDVAAPSAALSISGTVDSSRVYTTSWRFGEQFSVEDEPIEVSWFLTDDLGYEAFRAGADHVVFAEGSLGEEASLELAFAKSWRLVFVNESVVSTAAVGEIELGVSPTEDARWEGSLEHGELLRLLPGEHVAVALDK